MSTNQVTIPKYAIHICLVSEQTIPNYLPVIIEGCKPKEVYLLSSKKMNDNGVTSNLQKTLEKLQIQTIIKDITSSSYMDLENEIFSIISELESKDIAFNLTGGTKTMTLAAYDACNCANPKIPCFYIDTANKKYIQIDEKIDFILPEVISCEEILNLYGFEILKSSKAEINSEIRKFVTELASYQDYNKDIISELNKLSQNATESLSVKISNTFPQLDTLLAKCENLGLATRKNNMLVFKDEKSRFFCNGGWFEDYVASILFKLKANNEITDYSYSVEVQKSKVKNEIDALFTAKNRLFVIECKTKTTSSYASKDKIVGDIYKIDDIYAKLGGIYAKSLFLSYFEIKEADAKRCKEYKIKLVDKSNQIINLEHEIKEWIRNSN